MEDPFENKMLSVLGEERECWIYLNKQVEFINALAQFPVHIRHFTNNCSFSSMTWSCAMMNYNHENIISLFVWMWENQNKRNSFDLISINRVISIIATTMLIIMIICLVKIQVIYCFEHEDNCFNFSLHIASVDLVKIKSVVHDYNFICIIILGSEWEIFFRNCSFSTFLALFPHDVLSWLSKIVMINCNISSQSHHTMLAMKI